MTTAAAEKFEQPWLLLCEGVGDLNFFTTLFKTHGIGGFHIRFPQKENAYGGGVTNFGKDLSNISVNQSFLDNVKSVLVVSDNDVDMKKSFEQVQKELTESKFPVPTAERTVAKKANYPSVVVLMLPIGRTGNLESLCLESAYTKWALKTPLDEFVAKCPANGWDIGKQAKMRAQTILAATNNKQPDTGFASHWKQKEEFQIPVDHACFDSLVRFLRDEFPRLVA